MRSHLLISAVVLLILAPLSLLAGCGGDDDSSGNDAASNGSATSTTESTSNDGPPSAEKKEFIREADAICLPVGKRILAEVQALTPPGGIEEATPEEFAELVGRVLAPSVEAEIEEIRALGIPEEDTEEVEEILTSLQSDVNRGLEDPEEFFKEGNPFTATQELGLDYGFKVCGGLVPRPKGV